MNLNLFALISNHNSFMRCSLTLIDALDNVRRWKIYEWTLMSDYKRRWQKKLYRWFCIKVIVQYNKRNPNEERGSLHYKFQSFVHTFISFRQKQIVTLLFRTILIFSRTISHAFLTETTTFINLATTLICTMGNRRYLRTILIKLNS